MRNLLTFLVLIITQFLNAQILSIDNAVTGNFIDINTIRDIALYRIVNGEPDYLKYTNVQDKQFTFSMGDLPAGNYRALYKNIKTGYVDFIYNNENVKFNVNSKKGQPSVAFLESRENQLLEAYNYNISSLQYKLDSVQLTYFSEPKKKVRKKYKEINSKLTGAQQYYEELAKNDYCLGIIKATKRYNAPLPFNLPDEYLDNIIDHFFDYIDFKDLALINSTFVKSRLKDYVFYLHQMDDAVQQNELYIKAIKQILAQTTDDSFREEVLAYFIEEFINKENSKVLSAIVDLYKGLPGTIQNKKLLKETENISRTLIGVIAPDIKISETESLYNLTKTKKYLIIFWSSACHHCSEELPKIKEVLKGNNNITVITVGLEDVDSQANWQNKVDEQFKGWKNVLTLDKWESKEALTYNINATPTYFLLNKSKRIIAKPDSFELLKEILE